MKQSFIGMKRINAEAMTRLAYNELRGWELPEDENGDDEGYLVEYVDSPNQNVDGYEGYVSWSPKDVFDAAYLHSDSNVMRHKYKALTDKNLQDMRDIKDAGLYLHELISAIGESREMSLAKTKVEEAVMWATKHVTG